MTDSALDQAKWRVIAAQALREDISDKLAKLLETAALVDAELKAANEALARLTPGSPHPTRLSMIQDALVATAKENGNAHLGPLKAAVRKATA